MRYELVRSIVECDKFKQIVIVSCITLKQKYTFILKNCGSSCTLDRSYLKINYCIIIILLYRYFNCSRSVVFFQTEELTIEEENTKEKYLKIIILLELTIKDFL